jgi:hypothetical protein
MTNALTHYNTDILTAHGTKQCTNHRFSTHLLEYVELSRLRRLLFGQRGVPFFVVLVHVVVQQLKHLVPTQEAPEQVLLFTCAA